MFLTMYQDLNLTDHNYARNLISTLKITRFFSNFKKRKVINKLYKDPHLKHSTEQTHSNLMFMLLRVSKLVKIQPKTTILSVNIVGK